MKFPLINIVSFIILSYFLVSCKGKTPETYENHPAFRLAEVRAVTDQIAKDPNNARLYYQRGNVLHRLAEDTLALHDYKKAIQLDSTRAEYYSAVGNLMFEHKDIDGSVQWLTKAIELNPNDPVARLKVAKLYIFTQDYTRAFTEINTVLRQNALNPEGYFLKGLIYTDLKDTAKAISSYQTAIQIDPDYRDAVIQLGTVYSSMKNPLALQYFNNAFKLDTTDVFPLYARGMFYQDQNQYEQAKKEYINCLDKNPDYANAYFNIGWILMQEDSLEKAWRQFDIVTKLEPMDAEAYYNRGLCSELMGKNSDAVLDYKQALTFNEQYAEARAALKRLGAGK